MKVLFTANGFPPRENAGTELYSYHLARALQGRHEVKVFCRTVERSLKEHTVIRDTVDGIGVARMVNNLSGAADPMRYFTDPSADTLFEDYMGAAGPDIVHVQHLMGLSGGIMGVVKGRGLPLVVTLHDYWFICPRFQLVDESGDPCLGPEGGIRCARLCPNSLFSLLPGGFFGAGARLLIKYMVPAGLQRKLKQMVREGKVREPGGKKACAVRQEKFTKRAAFLKDALLKADEIIAPSRYVKDVFVENGFPAGRIRVIPHGGPLPVRKPARPAGRVRFGYLGSFAPLKGVPLLVEAFGRLGLPAELHIYGHGGENHELIISGLKKLAHGPGVTFHGRYAPDDLGDILAGLDALVIPSLWPETFSIVMREAFACGVPVIASDVGALPEGVIDGVNGLVFKRADPDDLAGKMRMVIEEPGLLEKLRRGIGLVKDIDMHALEIEDIYRALIGGKGKG
jgi:glycosyltransferase involved in cell wall biosynthesis